MVWPDDFINKVICGDCLEVMKYIPDNSIDLVVTDPPYCSGARQTNQLRAKKAMLRAEKWQNEWFGTDNLSSFGFLFFIRGLLLASFAKSTPHSHLYMFMDWRNYPLLSGILESSGWRLNGLLVWDKEMFGMGTGYRNQHEFIIVASKGTPTEFNRHDVANILHSKRVRQDRHPTEKPLDLICTFVEMSSAKNGVILDPFLGSGTTAVAAKRLGRKYIGIEINPEYCKIAEERLAQEEMF